MNKDKTVATKIDSEIIDSGLCTECDACSTICPYRLAMKDKIVTLDNCDLNDGRCVSFCPRAEVNLIALHEHLFDFADLTKDIGEVRAFLITRAADGKVWGKAQHGGSVTTLVRLVLAERVIETAIVADGGRELLPHPVTVTELERVTEMGRRSFVVFPTLSVFNQ